jgi:peptidoglycan/LPS O-acetylase OafA/YrhL
MAMEGIGRAMNAPREAGHDPRLDGLRAVAAVAVVAWHCSLSQVSGGSLGVDVFFVLSGWLITGILLREIERTGAVDWRAFMMRRVKRLVPALGLMVVVVVAADRSAWAFGLAAVSYTMNFVAVRWPNDNIFIHTWTLATEFQFYLVWPLVVIALARLDRRKATLILLAAWVAMTILREAARLGGLPWSAAYCLPIFHASGLFLGGAAALSPWRPRLGWLALAALAALLVTAHTHYEGSIPALRGAVATWPVALAEIAALLVVVNPPRLLAIPPLPWLGRISYGVYLWQSPLLFMLMKIAFWPRFGLVLGGSILLAAVSYYLLERRFLESVRASKSPASVGPLPA